MSHACVHCGQPVNKPPSELRRSLKRGGRLFCGRECARLGKAIPLAERFEAKVDRSGGPDACHLWTGAIRAHGYGHIFTHINRHGKPQTELAHRVAIQLDGQELPEWPMVVDHICKNMGCVNVRHLRVVTQTDNTTIHADRSWTAERMRETKALKQKLREAQETIEQLERQLGTRRAA